jgi:cytochrome c biogenesis protein CcmG/thiol:disulfide interchange protein DsbE
MPDQDESASIVGAGMGGETEMVVHSSRWLAAMIVVVLTGVGWMMLSRVPVGAGAANNMAPQVGFLAPIFSLEHLDGTQVALSDFRGKPVMLNFWATWCPPCRAEMPAIQNIAARYRDDGLVVLLVNQGEEAATVREYLAGIGLVATVLLDPRGGVASTYRIRALPTTVFIDREGRIRDIALGGPVAETFLQSQIESLLEKP